MATSPKLFQREVFNYIGKYDLAVLSDVIEHLPKERGERFLNDLFNHVEDIVISTNYGFKPKPTRDKNIHEQHLSGWSLNDFKKFKIVDKAIIKRIRKNEEMLVVYLRKS